MATLPLVAVLGITSVGAEPEMWLRASCEAPASALAPSGGPEPSASREVEPRRLGVRSAAMGGSQQLGEECDVGQIPGQAVHRQCIAVDVAPGGIGVSHRRLVGAGGDAP